MFACEVEIISSLDCQSKFQMFALFSARRVGVLGSVNLCKIFRQIFEVWENVQTSNLGKFLLYLSRITL